MEQQTQKHYAASTGDDHVEKLNSINKSIDAVEQATEQRRLLLTRCPAIAKMTARCALYMDAK